MSTEGTESKAVAKTEGVPKPIAALADRLGLDAHRCGSILVSTIFPPTRDRKITQAEVEAFCVVANRYKLDPFLKQIYAFPAKGGGIVPMVPIDGWLRIINDHEQFDGMEISTEMGEGTTPISVTCTIHRKDRKHPTTVTEYFDECHRNTEPWNGMPKRMNRHKSIIQCARVAFGVGGIYDEDEARDIAERVPEYEIHQQPAKDLDELAERLSGGEPEEEETPGKSSTSETPEGSPKQRSSPTPTPTSDTHTPDQSGSEEDDSTGSAEVDPDPFGTKSPGQESDPKTPSSDSERTLGSITQTSKSGGEPETPSQSPDDIPDLEWLGACDDEEWLKGETKIFSVPIPNAMIASWPVWAKTRVAGKSKMKDRTWLEMSQGSEIGGRRQFLSAVVSKALSDYTSEFDEKGQRKKPGEYACMCAVALEVLKRGSES